MEKDEKAVLECYRLLYKASTPSANFDALMEAAEVNERGEKIIDYMAYEIKQEDLDRIIELVLKKYKFKGYMKQMFKNTIYLGCSPRKKDSHNVC